VLAAIGFPEFAGSAICGCGSAVRLSGDLAPVGTLQIGGEWRRAPTSGEAQGA
jgi:hypothetical protein